MRSRRWFIVVPVIAVLLVSMIGMRPPAAARRRANFGETYIAEYWKFYPTDAAGAGLHRFDGVLPDRSAAAIEAWINRNRNFRAGLDGYPTENLSTSARVDYRILGYAIGKEFLDFTVLKRHRRDPMFYDISWGLLNYIRRDYAPLDHRIGAATKLLDAAPQLFQDARANLDDVLPEIYCRVAVANLTGSAEFVRKDIVDAFALVKDPAARTRLKTAATRAAAAIDAFVAYIETEKLPRSTDDFAIGESAFLQLLRDTEGVDISIDTLRAIAQRDLDRNLDRARDIAKQHFPGKSVADVMGVMKSNAYTPDELIPSIAAELEEIRQFCIDHEVITIPSDVRAMVAETPKFARWASAMMSTPGPFETVATEAYYDVTPVDPKWSAEEQRQWLADFNRFVATNVSVHEAYPGHYVQFLHSNRAKSELQKIFVSYAGSEGWAHYTEEMMLEEGFGGGSPLYEIAQLQDALLRNCRFICAIDMHARGMTIRKATEFFIENTFLEKLPARREAERGTFDPGYFKYTFGKLQILKLREDYKKKTGDAFSLKRFHDDLLSHGLPPIVVVRERMLGSDSGPSL